MFEEILFFLKFQCQNMRFLPDKTRRTRREKKKAKVVEEMIREMTTKR
jgi:hypothetical protein